MPYAVASSRDVQLINRKNQGWTLLMMQGSHHSSHSYCFIQTQKGLDLPDRCEKKLWHQSKEGLDACPERRHGDCYGLPQAPPQGDGGALLQDWRVQH